MPTMTASQKAIEQHKKFCESITTIGPDLNRGYYNLRVEELAHTFNCDSSGNVWHDEALGRLKHFIEIEADLREKAGNISPEIMLSDVLLKVSEIIRAGEE